MRTRLYRRLHGLPSLALAALLASCNGDEIIIPGSITLASSASAVTIAIGASGTATLTATRTNFSGNILLAAEGLPAGVTAAFSPATLTGSATQSTLTLNVGASAAPGSTTITVRATGAGITDRTTTIALTIPQPPAYTLTPAASAISVGQGGTTTLGITLARTNFTGPVTLAVSGLPQGATGSFTPSPTTGDASTLTIDAGTAATGVYTLTITGTAAGLTDRTAAVSLTIATSTYVLGLTPASISVQQGANATVDVALTRTNFTGAVTLSASGVPAGAAITFAPSQTTGATSVMTIATGTAAAGVYTVTITGTAVGMADRTALLALTITATPGYTIAPAAASMTVASGATGNVTINIARTNFAGDVTLAVSGLPAGATASFSPNPATGATSTLSIATGSAAATTYALTITGTAAGLTDRTAPLSLTITPASGTNVSFAFCASDLPTWVGFQSGTGPWQQAVAGPNNTQTFTVAGRGAVAIVSPSSGNAAQYGYQTTIYYASASELQAIGSSNCIPPVTGTKTVNGSVAGTGGGASSIVLGEGSASAVGDGPWTMTDAPDGAHDLLAALHPNLFGSATKLIVRRAQNPANNATLPVLDFASSEAMTLLSSPLTLGNVAASTDVFISAGFSTANGSFISLGFSPTTAGAATFPGVPTTNAGDLHELFVTTDEPTGMRGAIAYFASGGGRSLTMGPLFSTPTITSLGATPYARPRLQFASQAEYNFAASVSLSHAGAAPAASDRHIQIFATAAYFGGVPATWDIAVPDMSAAAGFSSTWMLAAGQATEAVAGGYGGDILTAAPTDGSTIYLGQTNPLGFVANRLPSPGVALRLAPAQRSLREIPRHDQRLLQAMRDRRFQRRR